MRDQYCDRGDGPGELSRWTSSCSDACSEDCWGCTSGSSTGDVHGAECGCGRVKGATKINMGGSEGSVLWKRRVKKQSVMKALVKLVV